MEYLVVAEVEVDGNKIKHFTSVQLNQKFNSHHEFVIRLSHDVLESLGSFSLGNSQKNIGKPVLIRLQQSDDSGKTAYEFRGIICEVRMEQSGNASSDIVLAGYSPTILLENGEHLASFYKSDLKKIVKKITNPLGQVSCEVKISPQYKNPITYMCQYKESGFHFLNRLSVDFSEFFFYDGQNLNFGKPPSQKNIDVTYGEDINSMQLALRILPMSFSKYSYNSKDDKIINYDAPASVDGLGQYASYVLKESNKVFSESVNQPLKQRVENKSDLENFVKKQKAAMASRLEVLTGTSFNPAISIGSVMNVKVSKFTNNSFVKEDYGKFLVIGIEHNINENGKYVNSFEAIPSTAEVIPVTEIITPIAEPQIATVKDNKDPDNLGRIRVQMLWQQKDNQLTDWVRVMTPDAGSSGQVAKNRGFVFIPEVGDQVLLCFRYNDPNRPFVLGSIFHGKTGGGGGDTNKTKSLSTRSGHTIELDDADGAEKITIKDKNKNTIVVDTVADSITISANSSIEMNAPSITLNATTISMLAKAAITMNAGGAIEGAAGTMVTFGAGVSSSFISAMDTVIMAGKMLSASGGKNAKIGSGSGASIELEAKGNAKFNSQKKMDISSKESTISGTDKATLKSTKTTVEGSSKAVVKGSQVDIS
ncbi:MAG: phage baseplate assembly protein V [Ferruginibacter sp.]